MKIKIVFIGGLSNGKIVYDYLSNNKYVNLQLVITYEDKVVKPRHVIFPEKENIVKTNSANSYINVIKELEPDMIIVAGWSELLSNNLINIPVTGTIGFHPSKLPQDKGRSVLSWQIEEGYEETALSMFYYSDLPDSGNLIAQEKIKITKFDYIDDILDKVDEATYNLMYAYFPLLRTNNIKAIEQDNIDSTFRRLRKEIDDVINWNRTSEEIYNKIRAISHPYPGAVFFLDEKKCKVWKAQIVEVFNYGQASSPGTLIAKFYDNSLLFKTKDSNILIQLWEYVKKD